MSKYVSLDNLTRYDGKIKDYISSSVPTVEQRVTFLDVATECTSTNPFMISDRPGGIYCLYNSTGIQVGRIYFQFDSTKAPQYYSLSNFITSSIKKSNSISFVFIKKDNYSSDDAIICFLNPQMSSNSNYIYFTDSRLVFNKYVNTNLSLTSESKPIGIVSPNDIQSITGKKTFTVLPESSVTPTTDNQLVNKKYVDETAAPIQISALPSAGSSYLDKIYQYVGATTGAYTNGYFYKCMYDGDDYYWENIPVQANATTNSFVPTLLSSLLNNNTLNVYDLYSAGSSKTIIRDSEAFSIILGYKAIGWNDPYTVSNITSGGMFYVKTDLDNGLVYVFGLVNSTGDTVDYKVKISDTDTLESVMASSNGGSYNYLYELGGGAN